MSVDLKCIEKGICSILAALESLSVTLSGDLTVSPSDQWEALLTAAVTAGIETAEITVSIGNQPISVIIDTSGGPVEVTGTIAVTQSGDWTVSVDNFPTSISINNFNVLEDLTLSVVIANEEPIEIQLDPKSLAILQGILDAINNTVRKDWEPTGMCVYGLDGQPVSPPVKQFYEICYSNTGVTLSKVPVLSIFNENGTIESYQLQRGQSVRPCMSNDCVLLGTMNKLIIPETGIEVHHWFTNWEEGEEGIGKAVPHDTITTTFPNGVHASGQPADSVVTNTNWSFNDAVGGVEQGASQTYAVGDVIFLTDGYIDGINGNTGEYIEVKLDGVVVSTYDGLTDANQRGPFLNPIPVTAGKHKLEIFISDASVYGGNATVFSETLEGDYSALPAYALNSVKCECIKVEKCNGVLRNCLTNEIVEMGPLDKWIECLIADELGNIKKLITECCCNKDDEPAGECPKLTVSDPVNIDTGDSAPFPYVADGERGIADFTQMISVDCQNCIGEEVVIRVTEDHEATPYDTHRGYINVTDAGTFTLSGPTNTFETASATGAAFLGIGYAKGDSVNGPRATRVYEITVPKDALCDTITLSSRGFGGVGGVTETIYSRIFEIVGGTENCNGC